jgi:hypothetical protein
VSLGERRKILVRVRALIDGLELPVSEIAELRRVYCNDHPLDAATEEELRALERWLYARCRALVDSKAAQREAWDRQLERRPLVKAPRREEPPAAEKTGTA